MRGFRKHLHIRHGSVPFKIDIDQIGASGKGVTTEMDDAIRNGNAEQVGAFLKSLGLDTDDWKASDRI